MQPQQAQRWDVVILGGGLAGQSLARHLLLDTDKTVAVVDRSAAVPVERQKVGESSVQLAGYYYSRVLDMEEHLYLKHFIKYNLRFYWKTPGRPPAAFEDCSQAYIKRFSNVASYQLDRNVFEEELLRRNRAVGDRFALLAPVSDLQVELGDDGADHRVSFRSGDDDGGRRELVARWVVDTSGRGRFLARRLGLTRPSPIDHGAVFCWVEGLLDIERLTSLDRAGRRKRADRRATGHVPFWLATNHFCGDGFWFWVIPLQGKTSLGLVFDRASFPQESVGTAEAMLDWVRREFPFFAPDLDRREVLGFAGYRSYAHDCVHTLSADRWAMSGEAGRFTDPLYSPGSDLIAIYNTLIVDCIAGDEGELPEKARLYETMMRAVYEAYVPSYRTYQLLGDREAFSLKYVWELAIYFSFYVFPFLNDLLTDRRFAVSFLKQFSRLGPMNGAVQALLADYYDWKKRRGLGEGRVAPAVEAEEPAWLDFLEVGPLATAETAFYEVGVSVEEARRVLARHMENLEDLMRWTAAHIASVVLGDEAVLTDHAFVAGLDLDALRFDPEGWAERWREVAGSRGEHNWGFCPRTLYRAGLAGARFVPPLHMQGGEAEEPARPAAAPAGGVLESATTP